jgi:succinate dehydrogenase/fumarate reductase flavoprotein subunit
MGGGVAGCPAAAKAAEHGLRVTLVEKSKLYRSGCAGVGIDHWGPVPSATMSSLDLIENEGGGLWGTFDGPGRFYDPNMLYRTYDNTRWAIGELEKLGVSGMRWYDGDYMWARFYVGTETKYLDMLRVNWINFKPEMTAAVRKRGVNLLERTVVIDLLTNNGAVAGATAVNTRTGEFIVIKAKAVMVATGLCSRLYDSDTPMPWKYKFIYYWCPASVSGDGWAVAYRAGANLANMGLTNWYFTTRDDLNFSYGKIAVNDGITPKTHTWQGREVLVGDAQQYAELDRRGETPLYYDQIDMPDDFHKRLEVNHAQERMVSFKIAEDRGFNPRKHRYEYIPNKPCNLQRPGVNTNEYFESNVKGLYAAGDSVNGLHGIACAATTGLLVGDNIHKFIEGANEPVIDEDQVAQQKQVGLAPFNVKDGIPPMELECAIRQVCERYGGQLKSEAKLTEGLRRLGTLRRVFLPKLEAKNPHYLMRCLEVRNILDLAELHLQAALERKETRGSHIRLDYPNMDESRTNKISLQRLEKGRAVLEIWEVPELKQEYRMKGGN